MPKRDQSSSRRRRQPSNFRPPISHVPARGVDVGLVAEHLAAATLTAHGFEVTYSAPAGAPYDLSVCRFTAEGRQRSETVQVKLVGESRPTLLLQRGRKKFPDNRPYVRGDFDMLAVIRPDCMLLIPFAALEGRTSISINAAEWKPFRLPLAVEQMERIARARREARETGNGSVEGLGADQSSDEDPPHGAVGAVVRR